MANSRCFPAKEYDVEAPLLTDHVDEAVLQRLKEEYWRRKFNLRYSRQRRLMFNLFLFSMIICLILFIVLLSRIMAIFKLLVDIMPLFFMHPQRSVQYSPTNPSALGQEDSILT
ncbi:unnamed protein product [Echinostoma caproni]|uniref:Autophagy-related protein 9 n=1 Tax=Echinostoma caproni TaxID=27848 RepID=A0A183A9F1_9TREM|nr:unnamed protein product [Echinostoma caproni]